MQQRFRQDFQELLALIKRKEPFAFVRFGDGEVALMEGWKRNNRDGWSSGTPQSRKLGRELRQVLSRRDDRFYIGTLCRGDRPGLVKYLWPRIRQQKKYVTYARIFSYGNYIEARGFFLQNMTEGVVLVGHSNGSGKKIGGMKVDEYYSVKSDAVGQWSTSNAMLKADWDKLAASHNGKLFILCAGPLAKMAVAQMWDCNRDNRYLDVGSLFDLEIHGRPTRPVQRSPRRRRRRNVGFYG